VWANVLWDHSYQPVPDVMQYEPSKDVWLASNGRGVDEYPSDQCSYSPLPFHKRFNEKTHLFYPQPHTTLECPMCGDPLWRIQPTLFEEGEVAECMCGTKVEVHADGENAWLGDIPGDERLLAPAERRLTELDDHLEDLIRDKRGPEG
jgi:hypothetical protein